MSIPVTKTIDMSETHTPDFIAHAKECFGIDLNKKTERIYSNHMIDGNTINIIYTEEYAQLIMALYDRDIEAELEEIANNVAKTLKS
jgi:hypothetical protein